jgi:outer membrane protein assembly factor BamB
MVLLVSGIVLGPTGFCRCHAADWPCIRGANHDGVSTESLSVWPPTKSWEIDVGEGYSSVAVSDGRVYTMGWVAGQDKVWCLDASTGDVIWSHEYPCGYGGDRRWIGTRSTPTVDGDKVYTFSTDGLLHCFDKVSGQVLWSKTVNVGKPKWGFAGSPLIEGDKVILNAGDSGAAVFKDTPTHDIAWSSKGKAAYGTPVPFVGEDGKRVVVLFSGTQVVGVDPADGDSVWWREWKDKTINGVDPVVCGNRIYVSQWDRGSEMLQPGTGALTPAWSTDDVKSHYMTAVTLNGYLYGFSGRQKTDYHQRLFCIRAEDGSEMWQIDTKSLSGEYGYIGLGQLTACRFTGDDVLLIQCAGGTGINHDGTTYDTKGDVLLIDATPAGMTVRGEKFSLNAAGEQCWWNAPVLSNGRIYCRGDKGALVCLSVSGP